MKTAKNLFVKNVERASQRSKDFHVMNGPFMNKNYPENVAYVGKYLNITFILKNT